MPQKVIKFKGINRNINKFNSSGECEELINMRPVQGGGHRVIRHKRYEEQGIAYDQFIEHTWGEFYNQIVVENGSIYWHNSPNGSTLISSEFERKEVSISFAGNVLMVYCEETKKQLVFKFKDGKYVRYDVSIKPITDIRIAYDYLSTAPASYILSVDAGNETGYEEALAKAASGFYTAYPHGLCGAVIIGCEYELTDGNKLWSTAFTVVNVTEHEEYKAPTLNFDNMKVVVNGVKDVRLHLTFGNIESGDIRRINVYATRPVFPYEVVRVGDGLNLTYQVEKISLDDTGLAGQVMYYQGSVSTDGTTADLLLNFGKEQAGEAVMDVSAGCVERSGDSVSYNNRFHFFKSNVYHVVQMPTTSAIPNTSEAAQWWVAYALINGRWILVNHKYRFSEKTKQDFIYPMAGVKKLRFVRAEYDDSGDFRVPYYECFNVDLKDSTAYNYSFAFSVTPYITEVPDGWFDDITADGQLWGLTETNGFIETVHWKNESNAINVSAPFNPFVFPVEYSYGFGGEIIDIATSYLPVSAVQYGQFPLTVFTTNGIYAIEQGNGSVLYGNIVPLQPYVLDGKALASPFGTFFVSGNSLYLLAGRDALCISEALNGRRELNLKNLDSYAALCFDSYNMISKEDFDTYLRNVTLFFDAFQNELWVCSNSTNVPYSYVFNMNTKMFYKSNYKYARQHGIARYAIQKTAKNEKALVNIYVEYDGNQDILLQSRPMPLEVFYTHIQRMVMFADVELTGNQKLCLSVFGSDNLQDWKCIISAQKKDVTLKQIRTNKAAKSYRDYIILVSGTLHSDTDISDIIADYTVVNRRLG